MTGDPLSGCQQCLTGNISSLFSAKIYCVVNDNISKYNDKQCFDDCKLQLSRKSTVLGVNVWAQRLTGTDPCISFAFGHD